MLKKLLNSSRIRDDKVIQFFFLFLIVVLGIFLRFYKLGAIPNGLNRDEASLGYTAYSLLKTGTDEHGRSWPVNIQSFGDWKLPLYVYTLIPIISLFDLTEFSVRLPSAIAGVMSVLGVYFLGQLIVRKWKAPKFLPLAASFFIAISPWSVHLSRVAYEANLSLLFFLIGIVCWFASNVHKKSWLLPIAGLCFGLTMISYHAFQLFTPLFILLTMFVLRDEVKELFRKKLVISLITSVIFIIPVMLLFLDKAIQSNQTKYAGISIFSEERIIARQEKLSSAFAAAGPLTFIYSSSPVIIADKFFTNLFSMTNPNFLFISGGSHGSHNIPEVGNMYWFAAVTLFIGFYFFIQEKKRWQIWIFGWLIIAAIPPLLTIEANHSVRFFPAIIALEVISAFGMLKFFQIISIQLKNSKFLKSGIFSIFGIIILISMLRFSISYFLVLSSVYPDRWSWYMKSVVESTQVLEKDYQSIYVQGESSSPYIYFLFYQPNRVINGEALEYYSPTDEGFLHAQQLGKIHFGTINWASIEEKGETALFIVQPEEVPGDKLENSRYSVLSIFSRPNSEITYWLLSLR